MVDSELLDRLRKADPETYERIARGIPMQPCGQYMIMDIGTGPRMSQYHEAYMPIDVLIPKVAEAWHQHVLQDAIRARKWTLITVELGEWSRENPCQAMIQGYPELKRVSGFADSPAEALLKAYLAAIECV